MTGGVVVVFIRAATVIVPLGWLTVIAVTTPIFIIGLPRSGSTLVEQILSNHSEVYGAGEIPFLQNLITKYFLSVNNIADEDKKKYLEKNFKIIGKTYLSQIKEKSLNAKKKGMTHKNPMQKKKSSTGSETQPSLWRWMEAE